MAALTPMTDEERTSWVNKIHRAEQNKLVYAPDPYVTEGGLDHIRNQFAESSMGIGVALYLGMQILNEHIVPKLFGLPYTYANRLYPPELGNNAHGDYCITDVSYTIPRTNAFDRIVESVTCPKGFKCVDGMCVAELSAEERDVLWRLDKQELWGVITAPDRLILAALRSRL